MKKIVFFLILQVMVLKVFPQAGTVDLGAFLGGATPFVDYTKINRFQSVGLDYGVYYRYNFNTRMALRINAMNGTVKANGLLDNQASSSFQKMVFEASALLEINYLDFMLGAKNRRFSPMVFTGLGVMYYSGTNSQAVVTPTLPIGIGAKYSINKKWGVTAEFSMHKLFNDELDNRSDPYNVIGMEKVTDILHNNDWIGYFGVSVMYRFYQGKKACPAYDSLN